MPSGRLIEAVDVKCTIEIAVALRVRGSCHHCPTIVGLSPLNLPPKDELGYYDSDA